MNEFWETPQKKKLNKKKLAVLIIILILLISIIIIAIIYNNNKQFKNWMDKNIFNKEVMQANTNTIELENENSKICAFNKKIGVLNKNQFKIYNEFGNEETNLNIEITNPIFKTSKISLLASSSLCLKSLGSFSPNIIRIASTIAVFPTPLESFLATPKITFTPTSLKTYSFIIIFSFNDTT